MADFDGRKKVIAIVAVSMFTVATVAAGVITGAIPVGSTTPAAAPKVPAVSAAAPAANPAPVRPRVAAKPAVKRDPVVRQVASAEATPPAPQPPSFESCTNCGVVAAINSFTEKGPSTGGGAVFGGLIGGLLGNQVGHGRGKDLATVAGVVGGALAGNELEKNTHKVTRYQVSVRMNDGTPQIFTLGAAPSLAVGDRVVIVNGAPMKE